MGIRFQACCLWFFNYSTFCLRCESACRGIRIMIGVCELSIFSFLLLLEPLFAAAANTITQTQPIRDGETIISASNLFELGFFSTNNSTNRYVGIWFHKIPEQTVVWVANRESPVADSSGYFTIRNDGNLVVWDGKQNTHWSTNASIASKNITSATLSDNGNLVLREGNSGLVLWQSFDHPSNTLLPGMKIGLNLKTGERQMLRSWKNGNDPAPGIFSLGVDQHDSEQFFIWRRSVPYWRSGHWNGQTFNRIPAAYKGFLFYFISGRGGEQGEEVYFEYTAMYNNTRLVMDTSGQLTCQVWYDASKSWGLVWLQPRDSCSIYAACGAYGICNNRNNPICKCMTGFEPASPSNWNSGNWSAGCMRKAQLECGNKDGFLAMGRIKIPDGETSAIAKSAEECRAQCVSNCNCSAYAYANTSNGASSSCLVWYGRLMDAGDLTVEEKDEGARYVYIRVAASELSSNKRRRLLVILIVSLVTVSLIFGTTIYCFIKMTKKKGNRAKRLKMSVLNLRTNASTAYDFLDPHQFGEDGSHDIPLFHFESISMATENFSISNKLGQGGFGAVYKGILPGGQEIAVKRLSNNSGQGLEEFTNEVILIAKLQHRNLVRLLGYCIEDDEMLLVYEYMPNKSLDFILFDQSRCVLLNWEGRFNIILGIARGLLYLHQDSRLRIIHRDLKTSNILLDKDMNPKISDFGIARIFGGNQTQAKTRRIFGTYGYMSPEYAIKGHFSMKSDVFSYGVIVLEIISGRKNTSFNESEDSLSLLGHAWQLWIEGKGMDLIDPSLIESCDAQEVLKCLQVGLLCVQEDPKNRPTMAFVVMFLSDSARLPTPEQPPFYLRTSSKQDNSSGNPKSCSINEVTITLLDGR